MTKMRVDWEGCIPAVITPFSEDGSIDKDAFEYNLRVYIDEEKVGGVVVAGHNGEPWALTSEEARDLFRLARRVVDDLGSSVPVIAGINAVSVAGIVEEAKRAADTGVDGFMITPPFYVADATEKEIWERYESVAKAVPTPIILYNNPRRTVINLSPAMMADLAAEIDNIVMIKQSYKDFGQLSDTIRLAGKIVPVVPGPCGLIFPALLIGAKGYISAGPDVLGKRGVDLYHLVKQGKLDEARTIHEQMVEIYSIISQFGTWPASYKVALGLTGKKVGIPRDPVHPLSPDQVSKIEKRLRDIGVI